MLILLSVTVAVAVGLYWLLTPSGATMPEARAALQDDAAVTVQSTPWLSFTPTATSASSGFIFYPGGRVPPEAYAPLARGLAKNGYLAVIVPMPFNLAVLDAGSASAVIDSFPDIDHWTIGGHSLGGSMAARYAAENPTRLRGLVLLASYPERQIALQASELAVLSIYAELDGLATVDEVQESFGQLPETARTLLISGGNHAQFGWYGEQAGDQPARISRQLQQEQVISAIADLLACIEDMPASC